MNEDKALGTLRRYFGYGEFRQGQRALIDAILSGRDCLGIMPTGGGKSLCYQVPAMLLPGVTLVVSPLISLMADQVQALRENGVEAEYINSTLSENQYSQTLRKLRSGLCKLLYIAPERLELASFQNILADIEVPLVAVDEAHCVSQWGQDFRPSYLKIAPAVAALPKRPTLAAFTATATERVRRDIVKLLELRDPQVLVTGFDRPNLYFEVRTPRDKKRELLSILRERRDKSGIVYCATRAAVEEVCELLCAEGFKAVRYHAGLGDNERASAQEAFQYDDARVMVATNAFGMGIDKSNVGYVIHYNMPKSLDAYYQEAGRAGRDGESADCILLYAPKDAVTARHLIEHGENPDNRADFERLNAITGYCRTGECLRGYILSYFGQEHPENCGNCGNCLGEYTRKDITVEAQQILSCIERVRGRLGYNVGRSLISDILRGASSARVREKGLDTLTTYGLMRGQSRADVDAYINALVSSGYAAVNEHQALVLTPKSPAVLFRGETVSMRVKQAEIARRGARPATYKAAEQAARGTTKPKYDSAELYDMLRKVRARAASEARVPAYVVFSNATLRAMADMAPTTLGEFLLVPGVGERKAERYGQMFLKAIGSFLSRE